MLGGLGSHRQTSANVSQSAEKNSGRKVNSDGMNHSAAAKQQTLLHLLEVVGCVSPHCDTDNEAKKPSSSVNLARMHFICSGIRNLVTM